MKPTNLSEYYQSIGQALPSVQQRQSIASQAGISGYRGTASQNAQLLSYLTSQQTPVQQVAPAGRPSPFPTTSQSNSQINLGDIDFDVQPIDLAPVPVRPTVNYNTVPSQPQLAPLNVTEQDFTTEAERLRTEIQAIESRMSNRANQRETAIQDAGLFDDIRTLANLRSELTRAENEEIAIPIEARQQLRGRGATITEFNQTITPRLEDNVLEQLRYSTQVSSLNNAINTELDIINQRIDEEKEADRIFYEQKLQRLNQIENNYYDIMSSEQKNALELAKMSAEFGSVQSQFYGDIISDQYKALQDRGVYLDPNSTPEQITQQYQNLLLDDRDLRVETNGVVINQIGDLLSDVNSLKASVGSNMFSRGVFDGIFSAGATVSGNAKAWRENLANLLSNATFQKLAEITEKSTLGAISEGELRLVQNAATAIKQMSNGKVDLPEKKFVEYMNVINNSMLKMNLRELLGAAEYTASGIKEINDPVRLKSLYDEANNLAKEAAAQRLQGFNNVGNGTNSVTQNLIKQLEGFSTTAYRDGAGWSIGYGNQTHPDGTPVRQGDTINPAQGDRYLQAALQNHSNWRNLIRVPLTEPQQAALASFEYNLGSGIWQGQTASQIINAINGGNFTQAAQLMQQFNKSQGRTLPVLVQRRQLEGQLLTQYA